MTDALKARIAELEAELRRTIPRHDWARSSMAIKLPPGPGTQGTVNIHAPTSSLEAVGLQLHSDWLGRHSGGFAVCTRISYDFLLIADSAAIPCDGTRLVWSGYPMHPSIPIRVDFENRSNVAVEVWATLYMRYPERAP
jgi:hypothetical protein